MFLALRNRLSQSSRSQLLFVLVLTRAWLLRLWCAAAGGTPLLTEVLFLCPRGRPWIVVCPGSLPAGSTAHLLVVMWRRQECLEIMISRRSVAQVSMLGQTQPQFALTCSYQVPPVCYWCETCSNTPSETSSERGRLSK